MNKTNQYRRNKKENNMINATKDKQAARPDEEQDYPRSWRIRGLFTLETPLHLGTGHDESVTDTEEVPQQADPQAPVIGSKAPDKAAPAHLFFVASVARDFEGKPYIPGSSIKGALRALAQRVAPHETELLFGKPPREEDKSRGDTTPGQIEFCNAYLAVKTVDQEGNKSYHLPESSSLPDYDYSCLALGDKLKARALIPHAVRNRDYGTTEEGLLFHEQVIPPKTRFQFECTAHELTKEQVRTLLGLLEAVGEDDSQFRLGSGKAANQGRVSWEPDKQGIQQIIPTVCNQQPLNHLSTVSLAEFWKEVKTSNGTHFDVWKFATEQSDLQARTLSAKTDDQLLLSDLSLNFHTPFLVYRRNPEKKKDDTKPSGIPRQNQDKQGILPASSLHGALRSQAERILRTVGITCDPAYKLENVHTMEEVEKLDLAALLFGAPGWLSLLSCTDFVVQPVEAPLESTLQLHHTAIDRLTGGGKKGALFSIEAYDCPTLKGNLRLDLQRIDELWKDVKNEKERKQKQEVTRNQLLGLLAHVLRDLDEGDIPLGYGAAKGYGACTSEIVTKLESELKEEFADALNAFEKAVPKLTSTRPADGELQSTGGAMPRPMPDLLPANQVPGDFHNPYTFLPFGKPKPDDTRLPWIKYPHKPEEEVIPDSHHSHARYSPKALHGRLVCKLTTLTPIFIGAGDKDPNAVPKQKENFKLNCRIKDGIKNQIALPTTSLRGMLSSLHESITRSALRVMEERNYSVRQTAGGSEANVSGSSAIGRIHIDDDKVIHVEPLTLPTMKRNGNGVYILPSSYKHCRRRIGNDWVAYQKILIKINEVNAPTGSHFKEAHDENFEYKKSREYWYVRMNSIKLKVNGNSDNAGIITPSPSYPDEFLNQKRAFKKTTVNGVKVKNETGRFLISQYKLEPCPYPLSQIEFDNLEDKAGYVRGLLRIMSYPDKQNNNEELRELPDEFVRHYEMFIPCPESPPGIKAVTLKCTDLCLSRFRYLAKERHELESKENHLKPLLLTPYTSVNRDRIDAILEPLAGDIVFFKPNADGAEIEEISYSSIWRARVEYKDPDGETVNYGARQALPDACSDIAPLLRNDNRNLISPSEMLFGFVQDMGDEYKKLPLSERRKHPAKAFASKVRFGFGRYIGDGEPMLLREVPLKILASPKPPCPSFYFTPTDLAAEEYIPRANLARNPTPYKHKGRKVNLHALGAGKFTHGAQLFNMHGSTNPNHTAKPPWEHFPTQDDNQTAKQRVKVRPIKQGQSFCFEIDFANLSQAELESLCATLIPDGTYHHKIGMGKPIGLGSVKIEVVGMFLVDRQERYRQTDFAKAPRYSTTWKPEAFPPNLPDYLWRECALSPSKSLPAPADLAKAQMKILESSDDNRALYRAIVLTGNPDAVTKPVHYPQVLNASIETKNFDWFVDNDKRWKEPLKGFTDTSKDLPTLTRRNKIP